eukprot:624603-Pyramimonas_sp.AAC.1
MKRELGGRVYSNIVHDSWVYAGPPPLLPPPLPPPSPLAAERSANKMFANSSAILRPPSGLGSTRS